MSPEFGVKLIFSAVIPTVNDYIGYLGANQAYIGIVISIFAVGSIISAPTMGRLADRIGTSRPLVLTGICCHLSGSVVYFLAPYLPGNEPAAWVSFGRFLAGIGYGLDGAIMGTLTKCAKEEDRKRHKILSKVCHPQLDFILSR